MNNKEKAQKQLEGIGVSTVIENDTLYVFIKDTLLELSEYEINDRSRLYNEENS